MKKEVLYRTNDYRMIGWRPRYGILREMWNTKR